MLSFAVTCKYPFSFFWLDSVILFFFFSSLPGIAFTFLTHVICKRLLTCSLFFAFLSSLRPRSFFLGFSSSNSSSSCVIAYLSRFFLPFPHYVLLHIAS